MNIVQDAYDFITDYYQEIGLTGDEITQLTAMLIADDFMRIGVVNRHKLPAVEKTYLGLIRDLISNIAKVLNAQE